MPLGHLHKDVEPPQRFQAASHEGDDARVSRDRRIVADLPGRLAAIPDLAIDAVENGGDLVAVLLRKQVPLPGRRTVARRASPQVEQDQAVVSSRPANLKLARRPLRAEIDERILAVVKVITIIDHRASVKFRQEHRRRVNRGSDNEVGPNLRVRLEQLVDGMCPVDQTIKTHALLVHRLVLEQANALHHARACLRRWRLHGSQREVLVGLRRRRRLTELGSGAKIGNILDRPHAGHGRRQPFTNVGALPTLTLGEEAAMCPS